MVRKRSFLLFPFSFIYGLITSVRNYLYDSGILSSERFRIPIICVGNITAGGTGKTPHTEYLVALLHKEFKIAVLSRGYKRKSKDFRIANELSSAADIGDEPLQLHRKFPDVIVATDRDRVNGIKKLISVNPNLDLVILDDGFQHRKLKPGFSILLSDFNQPIYEDCMLPYGNLRESPKNARRADLIIITKTPEDISTETCNEIKERVKDFSDKMIFFSTITYEEPAPVFEDVALTKFPSGDPETQGAVLLTGIAQPEPFTRLVEKYFKEIIHIRYPDHYYYKGKDLKRIISAWNKLKSPSRFVITTEKDSVRLRELTAVPETIKESFYFIPIMIRFHFNGESEVKNIITDYVRKNK